MKKILVAIFVCLSITGCANQDIYSGDFYSGSEAKELKSISYGHIVSTRPVKIQPGQESGIGSVGGAFIGGIAATNIGGGTGQLIASALGAVAGAVIGNKIEDKVNQVSAVELVIKKDDGQEIVVVQKASPKFIPGARVRIVGGSKVNVSVI